MIKSNVNDVFGPTLTLLSNQISLFSISKRNVAKHSSSSKPEYSSKEEVGDGSNEESLVSIDTRADGNHDDDLDGQVMTVPSRESQFERTPPFVSLGWTISAVVPNTAMLLEMTQGGGVDMEVNGGGDPQGAQSPLI